MAVYIGLLITQLMRLQYVVLITSVTLLMHFVKEMSTVIAGFVTGHVGAHEEATNDP
jgi:hypothetical protein